MVISILLKTWAPVSLWEEDLGNSMRQSLRRRGESEKQEGKLQRPDTPNQGITKQSNPTCGEKGGFWKRGLPYLPWWTDESNFQFLLRKIPDVMFTEAEVYFFEVEKILRKEFGILKGEKQFEIQLTFRESD